jgi:hypothetical protein
VALGIEMTKTGKIRVYGCGVHANANQARAMQISDVPTIALDMGTAIPPGRGLDKNPLLKSQKALRTPSLQLYGHHVTSS